MCTARIDIRDEQEQRNYIVASWVQTLAGMRLKKKPFAKVTFFFKKLLWQ